MTQPNHTIHNEQTKLTATFVNGLAIAVFAVGGVTQAIKALTDPATVNARSIAVTAICFSLAIALHWMARWILGKMKP
ncbi:amino acid transporter [Falsirhodobacter xinxiangensis]|uniref:amino acid transporter n=1 Tax=Falsirhodobacter xinxiangensis TaxID=2530049 RepID=UPI0010AAC663|nr:amino acid transporter [Rhodobacter xinxiangensis]